MSEPIDTPLFLVGEEVAVVNCNTSSNNTPRTTVLEVEWTERWKFGAESPCWSYVTDNIAHLKNTAVPEYNLRKLPPDEVTEWENCVWSPSNLNISMEV